MILQLRLDERLIHGQITTQWSRVLDIDTILVANDHAASNDLIRNTLLLARPADKKVAIKGVMETIKLLKDPRADKMKILIIVDNPRDALELVRNLDINHINIANFCKKKTDRKVELSTYCSADEEDLVYFKALVDTGKAVFSQMVPTSEKEDFKKLISKIK